MSLPLLLRLKTVKKAYSNGKLTTRQLPVNVIFTKSPYEPICPNIHICNSGSERITNLNIAIGMVRSISTYLNEGLPFEKKRLLQHKTSMREALFQEN